MTLHARLVTAVTVLSIVLVGAAFGAVWVAVRFSHQEQLDADVRAAAIEEAHEAAIRGGRELALANRDTSPGGEDASIAQYGVIYGTDGAAVAWTPNLNDQIPVLGSIQKPKGACFDIRIGSENARAIVVDIPRRSGLTLLIAASRADLDRNMRYLSRTLLIAFAAVIAFTALIATQIIRRFTRGYDAIADVTRRVADGDLSARVDPIGSQELVRLQTNINVMIGQLESLLGSQKRFVANAAHELRSPITRLYGELSLALRRTRTADEYRFTIEQGLDASRRLKLVAEDLLALARLDARPEESLSDVNVAKVVAAAGHAIADELQERDVRLVLDVPDLRVQTRGSDLERMFCNLLQNAVRHTPPGSAVTVKAFPSDSNVTVLVADAGRGIPSTDRARIFEPFWRGPNDRADGPPGTGLGLAIAQQIARAHDGDLVLDDTPLGVGAIFRISLPLSTPRTNPVADELQVASRSPTRAPNS